MEQTANSVDWDAVRAEFPAIQRTVYLNTAEGAALPRSVAAAGIGFYEEMRDAGDSMWPIWLERVEETRAKVASYLNAPADCIAFAPTTSYAMNVVAGYFRDSGITSVVSMVDSFPAITVPLAHHGFDTELITSAEDGSVSLENVRSALTEQTGAVVISAVEYSTGYAHDLQALRDLCQERQLAFVVDASQSLGALPLDVHELRPDFVAASAYKWLLGGYGLSVFYAAPQWLEQKPPLAGWMSVADSITAQAQGPALKNTASVVELGCPNFPAIFALGAAMDLFFQLGPEAIEQRVRQLTSYLHAQLSSVGFRVASTQDAHRRSGITMIDIADSTKVALQLQEKGVFVSAKGLGLRVSLHLYNSFEDIDRLVEALTELSQ